MPKIASKRASVGCDGVTTLARLSLTSNLTHIPVAHTQVSCTIVHAFGDTVPDLYLLVPEMSLYLVPRGAGIPILLLSYCSIGFLLVISVVHLSRYQYVIYRTAPHFIGKLFNLVKDTRNTSLTGPGLVPAAREQQEYDMGGSPLSGVSLDTTLLEQRLLLP